MKPARALYYDFVRRILYGFPRKNARVNAYPPLAGGGYGGQLGIEDSNGQLYKVRRTRTSGNTYKGTVSITSSSGEQLPEMVLTTLLGNHSKDVFERVFAFTLNELYSYELLQDEHINSQIYSAGLGVSSLQTAMRRLDSERESIFLNRGRSDQKTYIASQEIDEIDMKLRAVADNAMRYGQLSSRLQQVEYELECLAAQRQRIQSQQSRQRMLKVAWGPWNDLESAELEMAPLPDSREFPCRRSVPPRKIGRAH